MEEKVAQRIKALRQLRGLTIVEFATKLGFKSHAAYAKLEYGQTEIKLRHLTKISEEFDVSVAWLLGIKEEADKEDTRALESVHYRLTSYMEFLHVLFLAFIDVIHPKEKEGAEDPDAEVTIKELNEAFWEYIGVDVDGNRPLIPNLQVHNGNFLMFNHIAEITQIVKDDVIDTREWLGKLLQERRTKGKAMIEK